ncbi:MAG: hypothetical protein ACLFM1_04055 [Bacteroidales bacterium]
MRKIALIMIALLGFALSMQAQEKEDFMSKRGVYILPESGDIGLGFDAVPFFNYLGNMANANVSNSVDVDYIRSQAIVGKYYLEDDAAIRGELRLGFNNFKDKEFVMKDSEIPNPDELVEDIMKNVQTNIHLGAGYEMRRGSGRVQGYFGGMVIFNYSQSNISYDYGNPITSDFNSPRTTNFGGNLTPDGRVLEEKNLVNMGIGLRGFIGVEYFFAPKISIGGEFGWGFGYNQLTGGETVTEVWTGEEVEVNTTDVAVDSNFGVDTDRAMGNIFLTFHF